MGLVCCWLLAGSLFDLLRGTSVGQLGRMLGLPREVVGHWVALDFLRLNPTEIINISDGKAWVGRGEIGLNYVNTQRICGLPHLRELNIGHSVVSRGNLCRSHSSSTGNERNHNS